MKTLLVLGCAGTFAATASAQLPAGGTYSPGDFLLGFREDGGTASVVVDIGQFTNFTTSMTFAVNAGSTLSAQYGSGWATNSSVYFSLASTSTNSGGNRTNYVTSPEYSTGPDQGPATVYNRLSNNNSTILSNKINNLGGEFMTPASTGNGGSTVGNPQVQVSSDSNAYQNYMPGSLETDAGHANGGIAYGFFRPSVEGTFEVGTSGVALDLIQLPAGSGPGTDLGIFQLSSDGNTLTFTPESAVVPEPAGFMTMGVWAALALLGFQVHKRRKSSTKVQSA